MIRFVWCAGLAVSAAIGLPALGVDRQKAEIAELEASKVPRSVVQERKLQSEPNDSGERLKAAEAYVLEAEDSPSKLDAAAGHVDAVLEAEPRNVQALLLAGRINILRGQPAAAQASYQAAAVADPTNASAFLGIGDAWSRLGNDQQASAAYNEYRRLKGLPAVAAPGTQKAQVEIPGQAAPIIIGPGKSKPVPEKRR